MFKKFIDSLRINLISENHTLEPVGKLNNFSTAELVKEYEEDKERRKTSGKNRLHET